MIFLQGFRDFKDSRRERSPGIPYNIQRERAYSAVCLSFYPQLNSYWNDSNLFNELRLFAGVRRVYARIFFTWSHTLPSSGKEKKQIIYDITDPD